MSSPPTGNLSGDRHFGTFENGCSGYVDYTQSGWVRTLVDPFIKTSTTLGALIRADLVTTTNWVSSGIFTETTSGYGDVGQCYQEGYYFYECIGNTASNVHSWARFETNQGSDVVIPDASYLPYYVPLLSMSTHSYYDIPANSIISQFSVEATDTNGGSYLLGTTDGGNDIAWGLTIPPSIGSVKGALISWCQINPSKSSQRIYLTCSNNAVLKIHLIIQKCLS
jgi:hypothetical protein